MTTVRLFIHNQSRLLMLRNRRRVFIFRAMVVLGATCFIASCAFLVGLHNGV